MIFMENFVFYYTLFRNLELALASMDEQVNFAQEFIHLAKQICHLEAQTFLNDDSVIELAKLKEQIKNKIKIFERENKFENFQSLSLDQWRIHIALMCTLFEWCEEVQFFKLTTELKNRIFLENPIDGYYKYNEFFEAKMDTHFT